MTIEEITTVGTIRRQLGEEIRVALKDAGNGPAIDARVYATSEGEPTRHVKRGGRWVEVPAYCGPTKAGLWLNVEQAAELGTLLLAAVESAERYAAGLEDPKDWRCAGCNADNMGTARRCHACDASRRRDFLAVEA